MRWRHVWYLLYEAKEEEQQNELGESVLEPINVYGVFFLVPLICQPALWCLGSWG